MRLEATSADNEVKVWLTDEEVEQLRRAIVSDRGDIMLQLGAFFGLRAFEIPQLCHQHIKTTENGQ